jgi:hypothetical protein
MISRLASLTIFLLLLILTGCGVKSPPVQIGKPLPAAPTDLSLQQKGNDLQLAWTNPTVNQDGTPLDGLHYFVISRLSYRPGDYCDECRDSGTEQRKIYLDLPAPAIRIGNRFYLSDLDLPYNVGYRYRVIPVNANAETGAEARAHRTMMQAPPAPTAFQIKTLDRSLRLSWKTEPVAAELGKLLGTNLYKTVGDKPFESQPLNSQPITDGQYHDFGLDNNQTYRYGLRSVIEIDGQQIESAMTETIEAVPKSEF